jgi:hypothetical protein
MKKILFILKQRNIYSDGGYTNVDSGLQNSARFVNDMLVKNKVNSTLVQVVDNNEIDKYCTIHKPDVVIIEAIWVVPSKFEVLKKLHPNITWIIRLHSELPFLANEGVAMEWLKEYVSTIKELDYQFTVCLSDAVGKVQHSYTVRIIYTQAPTNESWFQANQSNITYVPDQWYCLILTSEYEIIRWNTDIGLDQVVNGTSSQTQLSANCNTSLVYELKPNFYSRLPQGSLLLKDGSLTGRISFRCHRDDPINLPINDVYIFTVRASTGFTYTEKTFSLKVIDRYTAPHENICA